MKKRVVYAVLMLLFATSCCMKEYVEVPAFNVSVEKYIVQQDELVEFELDGAPGIISFYSGELQREYQYSNNIRTDKIKELLLSFDNYNQDAAGIPFDILFSNKFSGNYTYEDVLQEDIWVTITDRFTMAEPIKTYIASQWTKSGGQNIADLVDSDHPFYLAFRYDLPKYEQVGTMPYRRWRFQNFKLESISLLGIYSRLAYTTSVSAGWKLIYSDPTITTPTNITAGGLALFAPGTTQTKEALQIWTVTKAFSAEELDMGFDRAITLKNYQMPSVKNFQHSYSKPGVYKATFVAANTTVYGHQQVVKEIEITVVPK